MAAVLLRFRDLKDRKIVSNHVTLGRWIAKEGFLEPRVERAVPRGQVSLLGSQEAFAGWQQGIYLYSYRSA